MLKFRERNVLPPGGEFFFVVEQTNMRFADHFFPTLVLKVRNHLAANKLPIPDNLEKIIEDFICHQVPENFCRGHSIKKRVTWLTPFMVRGFTEALFGTWKRWFKGDSPHVEQRIADQRANICQACPHNDKTLCSTCTQLKGVVRKLIGAPKKTPYDDDLGVCEFCGCMLEVKVHVHRDILNRTLNPDTKEYPEHCWLKGPEK